MQNAAHQHEGEKEFLVYITCVDAVGHLNWSSPGILTHLIDDLAILVRGHVWVSFGAEQAGR